jgi:hypothetical protein
MKKTNRTNPDLVKKYGGKRSFQKHKRSQVLQTELMISRLETDANHLPKSAKTELFRLRRAFWKLRSELSKWYKKA